MGATCGLVIQWLTEALSRFQGEHLQVPLTECWEESSGAYSELDSTPRKGSVFVSHCCRASYFFFFF